MSWRETWRETVESFRRELRGSASLEDGAADTLVRAVAEARSAAARVETELAHVEGRIASEEQAAAACARRRELAARIGDEGTAGVAERFERRHRQRLAVLRRKREVLSDEHALACRELAELLEAARSRVEEDAEAAEMKRTSEG